MALCGGAPNIKGITGIISDLTCPRGIEVN